MYHIDRKEGNDQESIRLPNTFRPRYQRGKRPHLKQQYHNQNSTSRKPKGQFLSQKLAERLSKMKKNHQDIHVKTYNDRNSKPQQQKHRLGTVNKILGGGGGGGGRAGGLNRFNLATTPALNLLYIFCIYSNYWDTLTPYHTCPQIRKKQIHRKCHNHEEQPS